MLKIVNDFLNGITMYRLMLYVLIGLVGVAIILSFFRLLPFDPISLSLSAVFLTIVCWSANTVLARIFKVPTNVESVFITALILTLILTPFNIINFFWIAIISQSSKYLVAINRKHLFNPAAFAVVLSAIMLNFSASWWVGTAWMVPFVFVGGIVVARKAQRFSLIFSFLLTALGIIFGISLLKGEDIFLLGQTVILETPLLFFVLIMLTEPLTTPPNKKLQIAYGSLVGVLFSPFIHIGSFNFTPEIALLIGNIFSYIVSPKDKLLLTLKEKILLAPNIYEFIFNLDQRFNFLPGQYLEWTLGHKQTDNRGVRRYFTIASSPTEENLRIGIKFYPNSSTFKKKLLSLIPKDKLLAGQLAGEFVLPKDPKYKLVFIAGGIGITPFRSIIKYLLDINQKRDIVLFYSSNTAAEIVYQDIFDQASKKLGIKIVYVVTETDGYIDAQKINQEVTDYKDRTFYISGPHSMVDAFEKTLKEMRIPLNQIKADFFPGYV